MKYDTKRILDALRAILVCATLSVTLLCTQSITAHAGPMDTAGQLTVSESGAATYTIPIQVPPGTAGIEPKLALSYNSQAGNGLLGVGWNLSGLSAITRCPRTIAQDGVRGSINFDANDRFCLDGQRLMVVSGTYGAAGSEYRTERDSFSKIIANGGSTGDPSNFKVWTKAGQIIEYGNTTDSRIEAQGKSQARAWAINKISDTKQNYLTYSYTEDSANGDYYPARIDYTGNATSTPVLTPNASVQFVYETRPDIVPLYQSGSLIKSTKRMTKVQTFIGTTQIKEYRLAYQTSPSTSRSRIQGVQEAPDAATDCNAANKPCKPAIGPLWTDISSPGSMVSHGSFTAYTAWNSPTTGDFNGDGLTDFMINTTNAGWFVYLSNGDGTFRQSSVLTSYSAWTNPITGDFNGDGLTDVMINTTNAGWFVYLSNGDGTFRQSSVLTSYSAWTNPITGDFNGDGLTDVMINTTNAGWFVYLSNGDGTFRQASVFTSYSAWNSPIVGDFNGDGLTDLIINTTNAGWFVYLSNGDGTFRQSSVLTSYSAWSNPTTGDFNGDGLTDVMINTVTAGAGWYVYLSNGDGTFRFGGSPTPYTAWSNPTTGDFNGDGLTDFMINTVTGGAGWYLYLSNGDGTFRFGSSPTSYYQWSGPAPGDFNGDGRTDFLINTVTAGAGWYVFTASGIGKPDSISTIPNSLGATTAASYLPLTSSSVYSKGTGSVYPTADLQFPLYVVNSVQSPNAIGSSYTTTNYRYGSLRAEQGTGRGLLGFGTVTATQADTSISTQTTYSQTWPYIGLPIQVKKTLPGSGNAGTLNLVSNTFACLNPANGSACPAPTNGSNNRYFPYLSLSVESSWDLNGVALPVVTTGNNFDSYGNATLVSVSTGDGYSKTTTNTYATPDTANWYLGRLTRSVVQSTVPDSSVPPVPAAYQPALTAVSPTQGSTAGGTSITLTGSNFAASASVTIGGTPATCTVIGATAITCTTSTSTAGAKNIVVTQSGGTATLMGGFTFMAPTLTGISPNSGSLAGGTVVTLTGTYFSSTVNVNIGSAAATGCSVVSTTQITCTTPAGSANGTANVNLTLPGSNLQLTNGYTYIGFIYNATIAANTNNYSLRSAAISAGWDQALPLIAKITINSGVVVGSTSTTAAFTTGTNFPAGTALTLLNNGSILGKGGTGGAGATVGWGGFGFVGYSGSDGGAALSASSTVAISITNYGTIGGGGGGAGGGGSASGAGGAGGGGGGGQGSLGGAIGGAGGSGAAAGNAGTASAGGTGGAGATNGGAGGTGGALGVSGGSGVSAPLGGKLGGSGGAGGACTTGTTNKSNTNITWVVVGNRYGALN